MALTTVGVVAPSSPAATLGSLVVTPATGDTDTADVGFTTPSACPDGSTNILVGATGGGFTEGTNLLGLTVHPSPGSPISAYPMGNTFANLGAQQGATLPLTGAVTVTLRCINDAFEITGDFVTTVTFTPSAGTKSTYAAAAAPSPTATPAPTATPVPSATPTPEPSVTPTPEPSVTPTPEPSATPTPEPSATPVPTETPAPTATPVPGTTPTVEDEVGPGGTVETDTGVSPSDPIGTAVTTPTGGTIAITEGTLPSGTTPPTGYTLLGQQVVIVAPPATAADPLRIEFHLDSSLVGGMTPTVFRNGTAVPACTDPDSDAAAPDPCAEAPDVEPNGDVMIVVRTSAASTWTFGKPEGAPNPEPGLEQLCNPGTPAPQRVTLTEGTAGPDVLVGTAGPDLIRGLAGDDLVLGRQGDDVLCGGSGRDILLGGTGNDALFGEAGGDTLNGGPGDDFVSGGAAGDVLFGGSGNDRMRGDEGPDYIRGGGGDDELRGGSGHDLVYGDLGIDRLWGGDGLDRLAPSHNRVVWSRRTEDRTPGRRPGRRMPA